MAKSLKALLAYKTVQMKNIVFHILFCVLEIFFMSLKLRIIRQR